MGTVAENISKLETEAAGLVERLAKLDKEINSYTNAGKVLAESGKHLNDLAKEHAALAQASRSIIVKFDEINGVQIAEHLSSINKSLAEWSSQNKTILLKLASIERESKQNRDQILAAQSKLEHGIVELASHTSSDLAELRKHIRLVLIAILGVGVTLLIAGVVMHLMIGR